MKLVRDQQSRIEDEWSKAARHFGLHLESGSVFTGPKLYGVVNGVRVDVDIYAGAGPTRQKGGYTRYRAQHAPVGPPLTLRRQSALSGFGRFFGQEDVMVGNPLFDDRVTVDSDYQDRVRAFLSPTRQAVVLEIFDRWPRGTVTQSSISVETHRHERSAVVMIDTIARVVAMARVMGSPTALDAVLANQREGNLHGAIDDLHAMNESEPNIFTQTLEAEARLEVGDHETAAEIFDAVASELPAERTPDGWERIASAPAPVVLPAPPVAAVPDGPDQQKVIDELFDATILSYQIVERFERNFVNKTVEWQGTVTTIHQYRHDPDFGEGPGSKVTVLIGNTGTKGLISNEVHAVVQLPAEVDVRRDTEISFIGTLQAVDRFGRKLYVANSRLA